MQIAIDGPAGAGKSTIAKRLADRLKCIYVDTGAMYRGVGFLTKEAKIPLDRMTDSKYDQTFKEMLDSVTMTLSYERDGQHLWVNGQDVTQVIREEEMGLRASKVATMKPVRDKLVRLQQEIAAKHSVVMDGRDIGSKVLPKADLKVYLTASAQVRGQRRQDQLEAKGIKTSLTTLIEDIKKRDQQDMNRDQSPLQKADDAILLDSSLWTIDQVIDKILSLLKERGGSPQQ